MWQELLSTMHALCAGSPAKLHHSTKVLCKFNKHQFPILSIIDLGTRFQVSILLTAEGVQEYMAALERRWIAVSSSHVALGRIFH